MLPWFRCIPMDFPEISWYTTINPEVISGHLGHQLPSSVVAKPKIRLAAASPKSTHQLPFGTAILWVFFHYLWIQPLRKYWGMMTRGWAVPSQTVGMDPRWCPSSLAKLDLKTPHVNFFQKLKQKFQADGEGKIDKGGGGGSIKLNSCMWRVLCDQNDVRQGCV